MHFRDHRYEWMKPFSTVHHTWTVIGPRSALSFHVIASDPEPIAGLELHYFNPPNYMTDSAPSNLNCAYAGGRCWHEGTSLYAMETLWPRIKPLLDERKHEEIFNILEREIGKNESND